MNTISVNMGAGTASAAFLIPSSDWAIINSRVYLVLNYRASGPVQQSGQVPEFAQLMDVCSTWNATTFKALIDLAANIVNYGETVVPGKYQVLQNIIDGMKNNVMAEQDAITFKLTIQDLMSSVAQLRAAAATVAQQVQKFSDVNEQVDQETAGNSKWTVIAPTPSKVANAAEKVKGTWDAICNDLGNLQESVSRCVANNNVFILDLNLQVAMEDWAQTANEARAFIADAPAQQKYLSGGFGYDDPALVETQYYRLFNTYLGNNRFLDTYNNESNQPFMNNGENTSGSYWKFTRTGGGWYQLTNQFLGSSRYLDTYSNDSNTPFMGNSPNTSGSFWKLIPVGDGAYHLTNSYLGDNRFLDTYSNDNNAPFMNDGTNTTGSAWKLTN
ncbi:MAG TPA: hypothetical protein VIF10_12460 [Methylobacter sp.]